jgi:hypothetical protein
VHCTRSLGSVRSFVGFIFPGRDGKDTSVEAQMTFGSTSNMMSSQIWLRSSAGKSGNWVKVGPLVTLAEFEPIVKYVSLIVIMESLRSLERW